MSLLCSQCAHENPDQSTFCIRCGNRLPSNVQPSNLGPTSGQSLPPSSYPATVASAPPLSAYAPPPSIPPYSPSSPSSYLSYEPASQGAAPSDPYPMQMGKAAHAQGVANPYPMQMGTGQGQGSLRRAFAGHGTLIFHHSWLINGGSEQTANARATILDILRQRNIPGLNINPQKLMERGLLMEERDYLVARRGVSTIFTYAAPAGNDLYISRATTVLPAISNVRVVIVSLALIIMIIGFAVRPSPYNILSGDIGGYLIGSFLSLLSIPILLFFIYALVRSFIYWLIEKDFWMMLRPNHLNDFQLDDIMLLEHVTEDTVRTAMKQIGLDASQITPPPMGYQPKRRIRTI